MSSREGRGFLYAAVAAASVFALTVVLDAPNAVALGSVMAVLAGEVFSRSIGGDEKITVLGYVLAAGIGGTVAGVLAGTDVTVSVTVGSVAAFAAGVARSLRASVWITVVVAAIGGWTAAVIGVTGPAAFLAAAAVGVVVLASVAGYIGVMTPSGAAAGALLSYVVLVAGGVGWFVVLGVFVFTGAATTAYGRDEKVRMGLAEHTDGRGFANVAANGSVALAAAVVYAGSPNELVSTAAALGFVGCMATAAADTASSEIGSVAGEPRLITTFERVPPGTDGGVSWQGELVTVAAVALIGVAAYVLGVVAAAGALIAAFGGLVGAHVDSVLGATVEGRYLGNGGVNFSACTVGATVAAVLGYLI